MYTTRSRLKESSVSEFTLEISVRMNSSAAQWKSRRCELSLVAAVSHTAIFKISGSVEGRLISARLNWVVLCRIIWAHSWVWTSANVGLAWLDNGVLFSVSHSSLGTSGPT